MSARILVVDDNLANRRLMQAKLEAKYYSVLLAENGEKALEIARVEQPEIILLDIMMPGMDGYETCRRLKASPRTSHIPVVMLTALSETSDRVRGLEAGADDFLTKPVDEFSLMARIGALNRYNAVANELRRREASGRVNAGSLSPQEHKALERTANILLIESNPSVAREVRAPLERAGHRVFTLDQAEAQNKRRENNLDIVLLGLSHQPYDPLRLCAHFRTTDATRALSIIVMIEKQDKMLGGEALGLGASDVIQLPIVDEELVARVATQARRKRFVDILRHRVDRGLELSVIDQLTGLYNRRYMLSQMGSWLKRADVGKAPVSVMAMDIDHFKQVNDRYGHEAGDRVLRDFAQRLQANVRPKDIACRPGGEEFLVILPNTDEENACRAAERVRKAVAADPFIIDTDRKMGLKITVSAGVATYRGGSETAGELLKRADGALYRAKTSGRNRVSRVAA